jgi:Mrp family chromosome partitioning ATPase
VAVGLLAIVLALGGIVLLERTDRRLHDDAEVSGALGLPVVGRIPGGRRADAETARVEAFDALAPRLRSDADAHHARVIVVAPAEAAADDRFAVQLAAAIAEQGDRVLVLEANLRDTAVAAWASIAVSGGLTAVLRGESTLEDELVLVTCPGTDDADGTATWELLPAGPGVSRPTPLLARPVMWQTVEQARRRADVVLIAAPPLLPAGNCLALAAVCDAAVVVVPDRTVTRDGAVRLREELDALRRPVLGLVIVEPTVPATGSHPAARRGRALAQLAAGLRRPKPEAASDDPTRVSARA